jgi:hypothetical protein
VSDFSGLVGGGGGFGRHFSVGDPSLDLDGVLGWAEMPFCNRFKFRA